MDGEERLFRHLLFGVHCAFFVKSVNLQRDIQIKELLTKSRK